MTKNMRKRTPRQLEEIRKLYLDKGLSKRKIADLTNSTYYAIKGVINRNGWAKKGNKSIDKASELAKLELENEALNKQISTLLKRRKLSIKHFNGQHFVFGIVSDTHFGSHHDKKHELKIAYDVFKKRGITTVYHAGDLVEGEHMFAGQAYERYISGGDNLVANVVKDYPKIDGITTYFITGSHDLSYHKSVGIDVGKLIAMQRPDMIYLGRDEADIQVKPGVVIRLVHPGGGAA